MGHATGLARRPPPTARRSLAALALAALLTAAPRAALAFCGFYVADSNERLVNEATRVALMRAGTRTVLTMSNDYRGPPQDFAMVIPVPIVLARENVRVLPHDVFDHIEAMTAPRLVEYWEQDPCPPPPPSYDQVDRELERDRVSEAQPCSTGTSSGYSPPPPRVEARFAVGEYDVVILSARDSTGLEIWLHQNQYNVPRGAAAFLAPYVRGEWKFFVARVAIGRTSRRPDGSARLSPLRFHYDAVDFRLPVRLGLMNAAGPQDLIVYTLHASSRFEVANYRNVFIPTNLRLAESVRGRFNGFYAQLFDATLASVGARAVVTEYAWTTSSCDPCPTPPLSAEDLATLGADVLGSGAPQAGLQMMVTRMHARYNAATLFDDLVFREAPPVSGGHESTVDANGETDRSVQVLGAGAGSAFQARYVIRHEWTGPITCDHPRRGVWGGPPGGGVPTTAPARDLGAAPRGALSLPSVVLSSQPQGVDLGARLELPPVPPERVAHPAVIPARGIQRGCHCRVEAIGLRAGSGRAWWAAALVALGVALRPRRRSSA